MALDWQTTLPGAGRAAARRRWRAHLDALLAQPLPHVAAGWRAGGGGAARPSAGVPLAQRVYARIRAVGGGAAPAALAAGRRRSAPPGVGCSCARSGQAADRRHARASTRSTASTGCCCRRWPAPAQKSPAKAGCSGNASSSIPPSPQAAGAGTRRGRALRGRLRAQAGTRCWPTSIWCRCAACRRRREQLLRAGLAAIADARPADCNRAAA